MESPSPSKPEKSYISAAVESINPWSVSRSSTPKAALSSSTPAETSGLKNLHGEDHNVHPLYAFKQEKYPPDCPPLKPRWYHAVDVPKRKPKLLRTAQEETKPQPAAKKFVPFSVRDSSSIENAFQKLVELQEGEKPGILDHPLLNARHKTNTSLNEGGQDDSKAVRVPVQEDYLFDVDVERRELSPVYWLGPIFEVRRGTWFYQEGSTFRACEENLAAQLEEGYLKTKPFRYAKVPDNTASKPNVVKADQGSEASANSNFPKPGNSTLAKPGSTSVEDKQTTEGQAHGADVNSEGPDSKESSSQQLQNYRLFGPYMNSVVTYLDSDTAYITANSIMSRVSGSVYERFAGGAYLSGTKVVRGFREGTKAKESSTEESNAKSPASTAVLNNDTPSDLRLDERQQRLLKRRSAPAGTLRSEAINVEAEAVKKLTEKKIPEYNEAVEDNQGREIDHLILVTHGIGQRWGMKSESLNFINDVNVLRQNFKSVYSNSADLQALNSEVEATSKNCRVQVLPVSWRYLLDFPREGVRQTKKEFDIADSLGEDEDYPNLEDITLEGVPFVRSLITDLALDVLLYQSAYREHISKIVLTESNRIYKLFRERNPSFKGKVSLIGHSLGSAIYFDMLCRQKEKQEFNAGRGNKLHHRNPHAQEDDFHFDFEVEDFYCLGSPVGLFQMLKGRTIAARHQTTAEPPPSPFDSDNTGDPFLSSPYPGPGRRDNTSTTGVPPTVSSPKCGQLYNIFHPTDPISYRLEPLISPAMASMKPQALPYTKKGIFGTSAAQGLTGIGAKVGQSVSGLWSSLSGGIMNSVLNRSLGLSSEDVAKIEASSVPARGTPPRPGAGTESISGEIPSVPSLTRQMTDEKMQILAANTTAADKDGTKSNARTLIEDDLETLYSGFQKRHTSSSSVTDSAEIEKANKLRREELKVRALNRNGRVDYSIQENFLDYNPIAAIASHLGYWSDEDVCHFIMSQLLSRYRDIYLGSRKK